jgi:hypothetical protein
MIIEAQKIAVLQSPLDCYMLLQPTGHYLPQSGSIIWRNMCIATTLRSTTYTNEGTQIGDIVPQQQVVAGKWLVHKVNRKANQISGL